MRSNITVFPDIIIHIIEEVTDGFLMLNEKGEILFFNEVLLRLMDWRSKDILTHEKEFLKHLGINLNNEGCWKVNVSSRSGKTNTFEVSSFKIPTYNGFYSLMKLKTVSEEDINLSRNFRRDYQELYDNIEDGIVTADTNGRILSANPAFLTMTGYDDSNLPVNIMDLYVFKDDYYDKLARILKTGTVSNLETHIYTINNTIRRILDSSWIVKSKQGSNWLHIAVQRHHIPQEY